MSLSHTSSQVSAVDRAPAAVESGTAGRRKTRATSSFFGAYLGSTAGAPAPSDRR